MDGGLLACFASWMAATMCNHGELCVLLSKRRHGSWEITPTMTELGQRLLLWEKKQIVYACKR